MGRKAGGMIMKNVAIVGCGNISEIYIKNLTSVFRNVNVYAVCDLVEERAKAKAEAYNIEKILTLDEILEDDNVDIVVNLSTPHSHYEICKKVLEAGKNVYVEKPISIRYEEGAELCELADRKGLLFGCAPDTFMGAGIQTCRKIIDDGLIGNVIGASAFMVCPGHEGWHPDPEFYYQTGGGPMYDMGPYYLTALVNLAGPVDSVMGMTATPRNQRMIKSSKKYGKMMDVEVPTHVNGLLRFKNGAIGNIITSFDVYGSKLPKIEVYGTSGSIIVPDPNTFGGEILLKQDFDKEFKSVPLITKYSENSRGYGVSDMAKCLTAGTRDHRASCRLALHVLEIMESIHQSNDKKTEISLRSTCDRPRPNIL